MQKLLRSLGGAALLLALAQAPVLAQDLPSTSDQPVLPDPAPSKGPKFPAAVADGGTADPGPQEAGMPAAKNACSATNPCAAAPEPVTHVAVPRPAPPQ